MTDLRITALLKTALQAQRQGDSATATRLYAEILALDPDHAPAHFLTGLARLAGGQPAAALEHFREALRIDPGSASYRQGLAEALLALGRPEDAEGPFRQTVLGDPAIRSPWGWLADRRETQGDLVGAERLARIARCLADTDATAIAHAAILSRLGRIEEAWPLADRAARTTGRYDPLADLKAGLMFPPVPMDRDQITESRQRFSDMLDRVADSRLQLQDPTAEIGRTPFYLAYHGLDDRALVERFNDVLHAATPAFRAARPALPPRQGRRRIGIFSTFFNAHTVLRYTRGLMRTMAAREDLEVVALPLTVIPEEGRAHLAALGVEVVPVSRAYPQAAAQIRAQQLDVLIFADIGMEPLSGALASTDLAPRQIALSGHPDTTGIRRLDGYVICPDFEPQGYAAHYSEPTIPARFWPIGYEPKISDVSALERPERDWSRPALICAQSLFKIHPDMDAAFHEILERIPDAELTFIGLPKGRQPIADRFTARLRAAGIDVERRVRMLPFLGTRSYLGWIHHADAVLDSWHFSGGDSTFAALSVGAPVVTLEGAFYRGRQTSGLLRQIGVTDTVATTADAYVSTVERMVRDRAYTEHLRTAVSERAPGVFGRTDGVDALIDAIVSPSV